MAANPNNVFSAQGELQPPFGDSFAVSIWLSLIQKKELILFTIREQQYALVAFGIGGGGAGKC